MRGRVAATTQLAVGGVAPVGLVIAGLSIGALGARHTAVAFGGWLVLLALATSAAPAIRGMGAPSSPGEFRDGIA